MNERATYPAIRRFKRYPAYKDSGVEWLGEIPAGWIAKRLKNCVQRLESGGTPESDNFEYWTDDESGFTWVAISDMTRSFHVHDTAKRLTERGLRSKRLPVLPSGTLLYSMYASLGKVALLAIDAVVNQAILGLVTRNELVSRDFLRWWLEFMQGHVQMLSSSNTQDNLNADKVRRMPVFVPESVEQRAIAAFLDRETARIDALVAKKERLIELLQEKRTALITRAVTKGLDPTVPMKDSGVEWLGEIPAHWDVKRLKFVALIQAGQSPPSEVVTDGTDGLPFLQGNADFGPANPMPQQVCNAAPKRARAGDILLSVRAPVGALNIADQDYGIGRGLCAIRLSPVVQPRFGFYTLSTTRRQLDAVATGSTYDAVTVSHVGDLPQILPDEEEQRAIAAFLDRETARIDALVAKVRDAIDRLKELRIALISSAVTGMIDVREEVA